MTNEKALDILLRIEIPIMASNIDGDKIVEPLIMAVQALERQIPMKPSELDTEYGYFICGSCDTTVRYTDECETHDYCLICGQKIKR